MDVLTESILAQVDIDISPKLIFGLIFLIIWGISAVVSWLNKQQQQARRRQMELELEQAQRIGRMVNRPPPPPPAPAPRPPAPQRISEGIAQRFPDVLLPPAPPPIPQQRQRQRPAPLPPPQPPKPAPRRVAKQPRRVVPTLPPEPMVDLAPMEVPFVNITEPVTRAKAPTVDAGAIRGWMTPNTLRQQFILTEILQPSLGMRPSPHDL